MGPDPKGIGEDKEVTIKGASHSVPNLEVRVGAIITLEKIAGIDSNEVYEVLAVITVYIRENSSVVFKKPEIRACQDFSKKFSGLNFPRSDIRVAMKALSNIAEALPPEERQKIDLRARVRIHNQ